MIEVLLMTTSRSAPATSAPWLKAPRTTMSNPKRKSATANEPIMSVVRSFFRKRLAMINGTYFIARLRRRLLHGVRPCRGGGRDGLAALRADRVSPSVRSSCVRSRVFRADQELRQHSYGRDLPWARHTARR